MLVLDVVDVVAGGLVVEDVVVDDDVVVVEDVVVDEDVVEEDVVDVVEMGSLQSVLNKSAVSSVQVRGISGAP